MNTKQKLQPKHKKKSEYLLPNKVTEILHREVEYRNPDELEQFRETMEQLLQGVWIIHLLNARSGFTVGCED